ncbi:MAG: IrmA family protein [bacterium]
MKGSAALLFFIAYCVSLPANAIEFWHSNTTWAGQGQCSAAFSFDAGEEDVKSLQVAVTAVAKGGKKVVSGVLEIKEFGQSDATRYANAFLEGEALCDSGLIIVVNKATAVIDGKRVDLLKTKSLSARDFKPFRISIGK